MRPLVLLGLLPVLCAAPALQIVNPILSQMDGGASDPPNFQHTPGEVIFFSCRISGFTKTAEEKIHVAYSVQPFDPSGVPIAEPYKNEVSDEVTVQDKDWMPRVATEIAIPPLGESGTFKIVVKAEDLIAHTSTELSVPFLVKGHSVEPSDKLVVRNFRYFKSENDLQPMDKPVYHAGDTLWAKFDITGYKFGPKNKLDVSYQFSVLSGTGKVLFTQPDPAGDQTESFYPKKYLPAEFSVALQSNVKPGEYGLLITVKDAVGNQTAESKQTFVVQ